MSAHEIILLHGLGATQWTLLPLGTLLSFAMGRKVLSIGYETRKQDLEACLRQVDAQLKTLLPDRNCPLIVVGQSMGGIIGWHLHKRGWRVDYLLTIGSPLRGARLLSQLDSWLPLWLRQWLAAPLHEELLRMTKAPLDEPPHAYHCITMAWPFTLFDGCVYVDDAHFDKKHHTHLWAADHRLVFANPRLWHRVVSLVRQFAADQTLHCTTKREVRQM